MEKLKPIETYIKKEKFEKFEELYKFFFHPNYELIDRSLNQDITNISNKIKENKIEKPCLKHCCDTRGEGYWSLWEKQRQLCGEETCNQHIYFPSALQLEIYGAAASELNDIELYSFGIILMEYLEKIKSTCQVEMEIRALYVPFVYQDLIHFSKYKDYFELLDVNSLKNDLIHTCKDACTEKAFEYYNGEESIYYTVTKKLEETISSIYREREKLEKSGLWKDAKSVIQDLTHIQCRNCYENIFPQKR